MNSYKNLGQMVFNLYFSRHIGIFSNDVRRLVSEAFNTGITYPKLVETFIIPILMVDALSNLKVFLPISQYNLLLKTISKVIILCIRPLLDKFTGPIRNNFIPKKRIADNVIIAQEIVNHMHRKKTSRNSVFIQD